jgi:GNAT superfamily N-acetyltransferase
MIAIRHARPDDAHAIAELHVRANLETYRPLLGPLYVPPDITERVALWSDALDREGPLYVAFDGGLAVGFAHAAGDRLTTLYILRTHHRRGIGRRLLDHIREALAQRGIETMRFDVLAQNHDAIAFYEVMGGRPVDRLVVEEPWGRTEDLVYVLSTGVAETRADRRT